MEKRISTRTLAGVALFTALVFALQFMGAAIRFGPFSITLTLIPIVVGAALYGSWAGAWLGFVFSMVVLFTDTAAFMPISPLGTILTVLVKGTAAGFFAGLVYRAFEKKNGWLAAVAAAVTAPVVNTGLFLLGCVLFFLPTITEWGKAAKLPDSQDAPPYISSSLLPCMSQLTNSRHSSQDRAPSSQETATYRSLP